MQSTEQETASSEDSGEELKSMEWSQSCSPIISSGRCRPALRKDSNLSPSSSTCSSPWDPEMPPAFSETTIMVSDEDIRHDSDELGTATNDNADDDECEDDEEGSCVGGHWAKLPMAVLVRIFELLGDRDRVMAAGTCQHWRSAFYFPRLWRSRCVAPRPRDAKFARRLGKHVRELTLCCRPPWTTRTFQRLLRSLRKAEIRVLDVRQLYEGLMSRKHKRDEVLDSLMAFLRSQQNLQEITIMYPELSPIEACTLLDALPASVLAIDFRISVNRDRLHNVDAIPYKTFWQKIESLRRLSWLDIDYFWFDDVMAMNLAETRVGGSLDYLVLGIYEYAQILHVVPSVVWHQLRRNNLRIKVGILFHNVDDINVRRILVPGIPLYHLTLRWVENFHDPPGNSRIRDALSHVTDTYPDLQQLRLIVEVKDKFGLENERALHRMLEKCMKLEDLVVTAEVSVDFIEHILEQQATRRIHLKILHIKALVFSKDIPTYFSVIDRYRTQLKGCELNFDLGHNH